MTAKPIKQQILERILEILQPLRGENSVRKIERVHGLFLLEEIRPALHVVTGDESVVSRDNRGYTMEFPVAFEFIFSDARDPETKADECAGFVQEKIEADPQLSSLANAITYDGTQPFIGEGAKPSCVVVLTYVIQYRRVEAQPDVNY
jgi:hypothetical protein